MRILHLLDHTCDWEQRLAVGQLLDRLDSDTYQQTVASLSVHTPRSDAFPSTSILRCPDRFGFGIVASPAVRRVLGDHKIDLIVAWGTRAASAAVASRQDHVPIIVQRFDPAVGDREAKFLRTAAGSKVAIACAAGIVQRRLVETGVPMDRCVLVRPGVDFGLINTLKRDTNVRETFGIEADERLILMNRPVSRAGFHDRVLWAHQFKRYLDGRWRLVIPGGGEEVDRLRRLVAVGGFDPPIFADDVPMEELIASADVLVVPADADVSSTCIAWAMAAYVPVVGTATYSVAELIAHKNNGLLIKPEQGPSMSMRFVATLRQMGDMRKEKETARGQAYEVFGIRRFIDQFVQLIDNLQADNAPGEGITDSAIAG